MIKNRKNSRDRSRFCCTNSGSSAYHRRCLCINCCDVRSSTNNNDEEPYVSQVINIFPILLNYTNYR